MEHNIDDEKEYLFIDPSSLNLDGDNGDNRHLINYEIIVAPNVELAVEDFTRMVDWYVSYKRPYIDVTIICLSDLAATHRIYEPKSMVQEL